MNPPALTPELERKLGQIVKDLQVFQNEPAFWTQVVEKTCQALAAESGTFFELSDNSHELHVVASFGVLPGRLAEAHFPIEKGICGWVARNRQTICVNDVTKDNRFNSEVDLVTHFKTLAILCAPVAIPHRLYGVIEIMNPNQRPFTTTETEFLEALGGAAASLFRRLRL